MKYWLFKSEPSTFSVDDLAAAPKRTTFWDGVRNYQVRNMMRDDMSRGDQVFFYHSSCDVTGVAGIAEVVREAYPDHTAFDPDDKHYDAKSSPDAPHWLMVDIRLERKLSAVITLAQLRDYEHSRLKDFALLKKGNRLSILPVTKKQWDFILSLEQ